jgi:phosphoserine phosphatase RsbU/P
MSKLKSVSCWLTHYAGTAAAWNVLRDGDGGFRDREMEAIKLLSLVETNQVSAADMRNREMEAIKLLSAAENPIKREMEARRIVLDVQRALLPDRHLHLNGWEFHFEYMPAGCVGGDYCDLVPGETGEFFLFFGDVMGKGFAGSKISSQLNGVFRVLLDLKLPIDEMLERANRIFCERVQIIGYYATLVCSRVSSTGTLELINAGHPPPLLLRPEGAERIASTGLPLGLFCASEYEVTHIRLMPGETLLFYTDGVTEARNRFEDEYGIERLSHLVAEKCHLAPKDLVRVCRDDLSEFTSNAPQSDDIILLALRHI